MNKKKKSAEEKTIKKEPNGNSRSGKCNII
jgi:hypothetical protein